MRHLHMYASKKDCTISTNKMDDKYSFLDVIYRKKSIVLSLAQIFLSLDADCHTKMLHDESKFTLEVAI